MNCLIRKISDITALILLIPYRLNTDMNMFRGIFYFVMRIIVFLITNLKMDLYVKTFEQSKNTRPLRTEQLYSQEGLKNFSQLFDIRFAAMTEIGTKRPAAMRQTIVNPAAKPTKHAAILADNGINYDNPMLPSQLAAKRAERIALDKKKQQQAAAAQAQAASVSFFLLCLTLSY